MRWGLLIAAYGLSVTALACKPKAAVDQESQPTPSVDASLVAPKVPIARTSTHASWAEIRSSTVAWTYLQSVDSGCVWVVAVPRKQPRTISRHGESCSGGALAWTKDGRRGAWWIPGDPDEIRVVEFETNGRHSFAPPKTGELADIGFDEGRLVALMRHTAATGLDLKEDEQPAIARFEGEVYEMGYEGEPGLVLVYAYDQGWRRVEVEPTSYDWDLAAGVDAAPGARRLGPRSSILADGRRLDWMEVPPKDPAQRMLQKIRRSQPKEGNDWMATLGRPRLLGFVPGGEFVLPEAPLFREVKTGDVRPLRSLKANPGSVLWMSMQGSALAVRSDDKRILVDWIRDRPIAQLPDSVDPLMFWPRTSSTATSTVPK